MTQASQNNKHKAPRFIDIKLFIAAMTLAVTIGLWNLLSNNLFDADKLAPTAVVDVPSQPPPDAAQDVPPLPPLPTLVPVMQIDLSKNNTLAPANSVQPASSSIQPAQLRSVAVPTQTIVQQSMIVVGSGGGGGGGGGGGSSSHHAASHSSHK
ncbi:MAG: hypothetical protein P4L50_01160 [Anaerolineaceae bacterium]|nr:hypothetical protein [Anaerolineaceae bacterium]